MQPTSKASFHNNVSKSRGRIEVAYVRVADLIYCSGGDTYITLDMQPTSNIVMHKYVRGSRGGIEVSFVYEVGISDL